MTKIIVTNEHVTISNKFKHLLNERFFKVVDTEKSLYLLGLLQTDGNVRVAKSGQDIITLKLQIDDKQILQSMSDILFGFDVTKTYHSPSTIKARGKPTTEITFRSNHMSQDLRTLGITPNKSLTLNMPDTLMNTLLSSKQLCGHWLRGVIDGDGCITISNKKPSIEVYGKSIQFLAQIQHLVKHHTGIDMHMRQKHGEVDGVRVGGLDTTKTILYWIYSDATIYSNRKFQKYLQVINL